MHLNKKCEANDMLNGRFNIIIVKKLINQQNVKFKEIFNYTLYTAT